MSDAVSRMIEKARADADARYSRWREGAMGGASPGVLNRGELAIAGARLQQMAAVVAMITAENLPELDAEPPPPHRVLSVSAPVDRITSSAFLKHAWPMIAQNAATDPTVTGEPVGWIESREDGKRWLRVYFTAPEGEADA